MPLDFKIWGTILLVLVLTGAYVLTLPVERGEQKEEQQVSPQAITVIDGLGRVVRLSGIPERIVSLAPSNTEILFALGLGSKLIGTSDHCNYPPEALAIENVGGFATIDVERVVELDPDLVFATGGVQEKFVVQLEGLGVPVITLDPDDLGEVLQGIDLAGRATGAKNTANELVENMYGRITQIASKVENVQKPKVFWVVWYPPLYTAGKGTFVSELIAKAGGINLGDAGMDWFVYSTETLLEEDPDVIIMGAHGLTPVDMEPLAGWDDLKAVRENRVYSINPDIASRAGPRLVDALEEIAGYLHPDLFGR
jgi:iron complex transport system substrate-binding protein